VIDDRVAGGPLEFEIDDGRGPRRNGDGLHAGEWDGPQARRFVNVIEDLPKSRGKMK
jgi:hypothetical protein